MPSLGLGVGSSYFRGAGFPCPIDRLRHDEVDDDDQRPPWGLRTSSRLLISAMDPTDSPVPGGVDNHNRPQPDRGAEGPHVER